MWDSLFQILLKPIVYPLDWLQDVLVAFPEINAFWMIMFVFSQVCTFILLPARGGHGVGSDKAPKSKRSK